MVFRSPKPLIGMLHAPALPGSPQCRLSFPEIVDWVLRDADVLTGAGFDALMLENFGDTPFYPGAVPAQTVAQLTALATAVRRASPLPLGINVLRNDGCAGIAVAAASGAAFIRVNVFTGARLTDQGIVAGQAHEILRLRQSLNAEIAVFADVAVKHSAPLADRPPEDEIEDTLHRGHADAIIVSGAGTGKQTPLERLRQAKRAAGDRLVLTGSGANEDSIGDILAACDGAIIGTSIKHDGRTTAPVDPARARRLIERAAQYRKL